MVECHFYAVPWDDFTRRLAEAEDIEDVVEHIAEQQVGPSDPSKSRQMDFIEAYKSFARSWESPSREHGDMLRRAADEGKGIAEYVFG